jgi:phasin family protein
MAKANGDSFFDIQKLMSEWRLPGFDLDAVAEYQRKNMEALTRANQMALEVTQTWMRHSIELAQETMTDMQAMMGEMTKPATSMEDRLARQAEYSKKTIEKGLDSIRDMTELVVKTNAETFGVLSKRVTEGLEEVRDLTPKAA